MMAFTCLASKRLSIAHKISLQFPNGKLKETYLGYVWTSYGRQDPPTLASTFADTTTADKTADRNVCHTFLKAAIDLGAAGGTAGGGGKAIADNRVACALDQDLLAGGAEGCFTIRRLHIPDIDVVESRGFRLFAGLHKGRARGRRKVC